MPDEAVGEDKGTLVRAHLLRGVVPAPEAPEGELRVAALNGGGDAVGQVVRAVKVRRLDDGFPRQTAPRPPQARKI